MPTLSQKKEFVSKLTTDLSGANILIVLDYRGLTVAQMTSLRRGLRAEGVKVTVAKNTLAKRVAAGTDVELLGPYLKGPTALIIGRGDEVSAVKAVKKFLKDNKKENELRAAFMEGKAFSAIDVDNIANMPSRDELRGKLLMCIASPLMGLANVLSSNQSGLVRLLDQMSALKQEGKI
jgi:large subunit ribosomal protein L10